MSTSGKKLTIARFLIKTWLLAKLVPVVCIAEISRAADSFLLLCVSNVPQITSWGNRMSAFVMQEEMF